jgi:hypothetical protein
MITSMADSDPVPVAPHPLGQLTTSELRRYKRELEGALALGPSGLPADAPYRGTLEAKLSAVIMEESRRAELASVSRRRA